MQDEEENRLEPDEELILPDEDNLERRRQAKQKVVLPERTAGSPLLRRVIVGDVREKGADSEAKPERPERRGPEREIGGTVPRDAPSGDDRPARESRAHLPGNGERPQEVGERSPANADRRDVAEVFTRAATDAAGDGAPPVDRPRRRKSRVDQESEWGRGRSSLWWLGAGVLCLLLIGGAVLLVVYKGAAEGRDAAGGALPRSQKPATGESDIAYESLPIAVFVARSAELLPEVREILMTSESGEGGAELLRGGEASLQLRTAWRKRYPRPAPFREEGLHEIHASGTQRFAYLMMTGERDDYSYLEAYFVKEDGGMLLDWQATEGYSEVLVDELEILRDGKPRMMRAVVTLSSFYTDVYPDEKYRCYTLHHDDPGEWIWAYAERNGEVDIGLLSHMSRPDPLGRARKVTVRIAKQEEGSRANQVELVEFLFGGWVAPPARDGGQPQPEGPSDG